jgi:hypothetical protein
MIEIKDALDRVHARSVNDDIDGLFAPGTALSRYLRGVAHLQGGLPIDWRALRADVARAAYGHERSLMAEVLLEVRDVAAMFPTLRTPLSDVELALEQLFASVDSFEDSVSLYLGGPQR